jgi:hypothetical protein
MRLPQALLGGVALALGLSLLAGIGREGAGTDLLSTRATGVAGIERWEKQALSGGSKGGLDGEAATAMGREGRGTRARDVEAMVQEWEDKTLSGRKGSLGAAESAEGREQHSIPRSAGDGTRARGMRKKEHHEAMARRADVESQASATAARAPAPIQEPAVASAPVREAEPTTSSSSSSSASRQEQSSSEGSKSSRMVPTMRQDEAPRVPRAAPAVSAKPAAAGSAAAVVVDRELDSKAKEEERKASQLVSYADRVAQRIIKEKALDAMKRWLSEQRQRVAEQREKHAASTQGSSTRSKGHLDRAKHSVHRAAVHGGASSINGDEEMLERVLDEVQDDTRRLDQGDGVERKDAMAELTADVREAKRVGERVAEDKQAKRAAEPKAPVAAAAADGAKAAPAKSAKDVPVPKPAAKKTQDERIRQEYEAWRKSEVHDYAKEHNLFSANEFCNSRQNADHPTVGEMIKLFGDQWRTMALSNPEVATLAAVSPCLSALGVETPGVATKSVYAQAWKKGPLAGKEGAVKKCAGGDRKACVEIAKDPEALRELKTLIPHKLISKK